MKKIFLSLLALIFIFTLTGCNKPCNEDPNYPYYGPTEDKPILYIYPTEDMYVNVKLSNEEDLLTTYPKYNNGWNIFVKTNGDMYDEKGNYYYALYWDNKRNDDLVFDEGFYVTKDNAINFLEEKLSYIGLNDKEKNEFIMYWLPILESNEKSLVKFELTDELQNRSEILINPKPDNFIRVHINIKKVDKETNVKEQKLIKYDRNGYTAVEWGGTIY